LLALVALCLLSAYPKHRLETSALGSSSDRGSQQAAALTRAQGGGYGRWVRLKFRPGWWRPRYRPRTPIFATIRASIRRASRALVLNARAGRIAYGGSTITQQLAGLLEPQPRTLLGKLFEARDAVRLEATLGKDEILEQYLNRAYYGRLATGAEAASARFFGKHAAELTLDEAALLAILPRAPTAYFPMRHPVRALSRRAHVLARLAERAGGRRAGQARGGHAIALIDSQNQPRAPSARCAAARAFGSRAVCSPRLSISGCNSGSRRDSASTCAISRKTTSIRRRSSLLDNRTGDVLAMIGSRDYADEQRPAR
jgi:membrane carboxypeptidase/penicillin-binding protein PbpC